MTNLFFVLGASGSGKSAIIPLLKETLGSALAVYDFDDIGVPENATTSWRQESTEKWLQTLKDHKACLLGQMVLGEILACPSANYLEKVPVCFLDVADAQRQQRLKKRGEVLDQHMINWSSWLRQHHQEPQYRQHVIKDQAWEGLDFSHWDKLSQWPDKIDITLIDTTPYTIEETAQEVIRWVKKFECP